MIHAVEIASGALRFRDLQHWHATRLVGAGLLVGDTGRQRRHLAHVERLRAMPYPWEQLIK